MKEATFTSPKARHWVQRVTTATRADKPVTVYQKSTTTHPWGYAAVEIQGTCS